MDDYELQEAQIEQALNKYRKNRSRQLYKQVLHQLDQYYLYLDQNFASDEKYQWHSQQKKKLNELKREKDDIVTQNIGADKTNARLVAGGEAQNMGIEFTRKLEEQIKKELDRVQAGTQKAIQISTYIKLELNRQMEVLDDVYEQNIDTSHRLERAKKGLIVILRRAMLNKLTRFLVVLLILAIIGLITLYILKGQGII